MSKTSQSNNIEKTGNPVLSSRIDPEIHSSFEAICDKLKIKKSVVIQELVKDFIVRNIDKADHENAEIVAPKIKESFEDWSFFDQNHLLFYLDVLFFENFRGKNEFIWQN